MIRDIDKSVKNNMEKDVIFLLKGQIFPLMSNEMWELVEDEIAEQVWDPVLDGAFKNVWDEIGGKIYD